MATGSQDNQNNQKSWEVRMLYDGDCPLCKREVNFLMSRDAGKGKIDFVDIASPSYNPADNMGLSYEQAMERIHAITADGQILTDIAVFRRLYQAVGLGWVYAITQNPTIEALANKIYGIWAKYRMEVTGRESLPVILERHRQNKAGATGSPCAQGKQEARKGQ
ncbi:hypothetical protein DUNSADRAFT_3087 [Dunaliella salina]|uniref:Thiol-disulfide oxidoreductase n=1 Tax=Dunaliella salina TaxID=3046 RepID=A0ABQ7GUK1_DUNSA|nr:hypothetical protein DUNSADRAFT_3087 [Dunaliella salina]|eukprot:KAF5838291.1 hypothetical protein DUNSADRAFT_3087 [Dunaliella salina]